MPLRNKLIVTYLVMSAFTALIIYVFTYATSEARVDKLVANHMVREMVNEVESWYANEQSWAGFPEYFKSLHPPIPQGKEQGWDNLQNGGTKKAGLVTSERRVLLKYLDFQPGDMIPQAYLAKARPVKYQQETIAWVIPPETTGISFNSQLQVFLDNILDVVFMSLAVSLLASLTLGVVFAKFIVKPIETLIKATSGIASGKLNQKTSSDRDDEIGDLSRSFNKMSEDLVTADKQRRQLTADVTHDIGTPIQVISGYIEMAQEGQLVLNEERIAIIASELEQVRRLVSDMSLLAQTDAKTLSIQLAPTDIPSLLCRMVRMHQFTCDAKGIELKLDYAEPLPQPELDEVRMIQVLGNLINNAIRYVPQGGTITIGAYCYDNRLILKVSDSGCGIAPNDLPFIFDRFYRSDVSRTGTSGKMGLGLSISRGLVEMQGGTIRAESDGKAGSQFLIEIPC